MSAFHESPLHPPGDAIVEPDSKSSLRQAAMAAASVARSDIAAI